jgi:hypothetical protein
VIAADQRDLAVFTGYEPLSLYCTMADQGAAYATATVAELQALVVERDNTIQALKEKTRGRNRSSSEVSTCVTCSTTT